VIPHPALDAYREGMSDFTTPSQQTASQQTASGPGPASALGRFSDELVALVEQVSASTVSLNGRPHRPGTATVVDVDLVVTADHSVERDDDLTVQAPDGRSLKATLVGRDPASDLALLRVPELNGVGLPVATVPPRVGALALAVPRSWQGRSTARLGIVSSVSGSIRYGRGIRLDNVIVPDISLARGLSGSPLVNAQGEQLGIVTTALVRGLPIAIPNETVAQTIATLREHGRVRRGYLGVALQTVRLTDRQRAVRDQSRGALIVGLSGGGPADAAGLLVGDIIVAAASTKVSEIEDVQSALQRVPVGATLPIELLRGATLNMVDVVVGEPPVSG
jgi:S1-C subfamily serine protease